MDDPKLEEYILATVNRSIAAMAIEQVREALRLIAAGLWPSHAQALRLAALRRYLRFQNLDLRDIHAHWAWTARETINRLNEEPARTLMQRARAAQAAFAENNRGYTLAISPVRSLARQVELWNGNSEVRTAAATLKAQMLRELEKPEYESPPEENHIDAFSDKLQELTINPEPGNAAPGLSGHGQMRAVDFAVMQGAQVIATTIVASAQTAWRGPGWADRLAVVARQASLSGPLRVPDEPWHWVLP